MKITNINHTELENVPSGSGITKFNDAYYVIGDDSPYLFRLGKAFNTVDKTRLVASNNITNGRIIKSEKPDFESLERIGENEMVIFGSGSKSPERDIFIRVLFKESIEIEKYDISEFYNQLRSLPILQDSELNIEATAFFNKQIYLFNRRKNIIIKCKYKELLSYIKDEDTFPKIEIKEYLLPDIEGIESGFSGATILKNDPKIVFTASAEDTNNAYDDGEILGSLIGMIDITNDSLGEISDYCLIPNTEVNLKVESVSIEEEIASGKTKVVMVTDDDLGNSILIEGLLLW